MGVTNLLKLCKEGASETVSFTHGDGESLIIIDGGMMMHRCFNQNGVAEALFGGSVHPLAQACVTFVRVLQDAGLQVIVVFDGDTHPAKLRTSSQRRKRREKAKQKMLEARSAKEREKSVKQVVGTSPRVTARLSRVLSASVSIETFTSPYEADAYLVFLESQLSERFPRTFVYANDSDLIAIGVQRMVVDIKRVARGELEGLVFSRATLLQPPSRILRDPLLATTARCTSGY